MHFRGWTIALASGTLFALLLAGLAQDSAFRAHMGVLTVVLGLATIVVMRLPAAAGDCGRRLLRRAHPIRLDPHHLLGHRGHARRRRDRPPARLSRPQLRTLVQLRATAPAAYVGRGLRVRRHRAPDHELLGGAAHLPRPADQRQPRVVRLLGLPALHRDGGNRVPARHHRGPRICRARMVRRSLADDRLGRLSRPVPRHAHQAQGTAHLRRQLVLPGVHRHRCAAARRQQSQRSRVAARIEELFALLGRPGRADPVVVRPQRGGLLPDRRLPRHDVLLPAQAGGAPRLFLPPVDHPLLGAHLPLHLGRSAPPPLHGTAGLGADPWDGVLDHALDAVAGAA